MAKNTASDGRSGLLESEEAKPLSRSKFNVEIPDIPNPVLDGPANREAEKPFLRSQRRVPVRRRGSSRFAARFGLGTRWIRLLQVVVIVTALALLAMAGFAAESFFLHDRYFTLPSANNIQVDGNRVVTRSQVLAFFAPDLGHSIFHVPLAKRQSQVEQIQWVRSATVMRLWPNRLRVSVAERTPVAFALVGSTVRLVDDQGVLLDLPDAVAQHYSFPVLTGIAPADPLSIRAARIEMYLQFAHALDAEGGHISSTLSQVDLSDPEDLRAIFFGAVREPLVHFGDSDYLARYQAYQAHLGLWLQQYPQLRSVDMRYGRQVVLDTGAAAAAPSAPIADSGALDNAAIAGQSGTSPTASKSTAQARTKGTRHAAAVRQRNATHRHRARSRESRHQPERGEPVRHPIMHVVSGM